MCFFVGNDFVPRLASFDIAEGALNNLFGIYKHHLPTLGGYLNDRGSIDLAKLEVILNDMAKLEKSILENRAKEFEE